MNRHSFPGSARGNKSIRGKTTWETLASLAATCCQQGLDFAARPCELVRATTLAPIPAG